jgi:hypothetical protein
MSVEVLLDNADIAVIGPPATVELQLDIGATGTRGSQIFSGFDNPNDTPPDADLLSNDLFIRESQGQTEGYIYQYLSDGIGGYQWEKIGNMKPSTYSDITSLSASANLSASAGIYTYSVTVAEAFSTYSIGSIDADNLAVQITPEISTGSVPVLVTIYDKQVNLISNTIEIDFYALKYSGGAWSAFSDSNGKYHITISLIA